ncbi:MAG: primosomal protein N' [Ignavibacteriaceae bacterium]
MPKLVEIVFPYSIRQSFSYSVPEVFEEDVKIGKRVIAPFGKRVLTGFITGVSEVAGELRTENEKYKLKDIFDVMDKTSLFEEESLAFYKWLSGYYMSSLGEALKLIIPMGSGVESKQVVSADSVECARLLHELERENKGKTEVRKKILHYLSNHQQTPMRTLQKEAGKKNIYSYLRNLEKRGVLTILDELQTPKVKPKRTKFIKLAKPIEDIYELIPEIERKSPTQLPILLKMIELRNQEVEAIKFVKENSFSQSSVDTLIRKGFITAEYKEVIKSYQSYYHEELPELTLTEEQVVVIDEIKKGIIEKQFKTFLLHGVTASGKTQVYIEIIKEVLNEGKTALVLVPEISLTPQITTRLINNFGETVSVLHSKMTGRDKYDSWQRIVRGISRVVVGPRSALFAPLKNIGIIVVDEEHDASYKQTDQPPRYNARDAAIVRGKLVNCPVVLGSATPSVESMYNATIEKYRLLSLPQRVDDARLPHIMLIDIVEEKKKKRMENVFSNYLLEKIGDRLKKKEGVIILQNRRGFSTSIYCTECGEVEMCTECSVSLVYHINQNKLKCHYCGKEKEVPAECSHCKSLHLRYFGTGTERVEDEIAYYFPDAKIERLDSDSIMKKGVLGNALQKFRSGEVDILVGTQMVAKGLDFSRVTLVGVISAETSLWIPDFRADERTFQLLTQVAGRSGRSKTEGEVLIQTQNSRHFALQRVINYDYSGFFRKELEDRKNMHYPPFYRLCLIEMKDKDYKKVKIAMEELYVELMKYRKYLKVSQPTTAVLAKLRGEYRFQILVKSDRAEDQTGSIMRKGIENSLAEFRKTSTNKDIKILIDIDPQSIV